MEIPGYRIEKEIGKGGMATVYLATQELLERLVVLKIMNRVQRSASEEMTLRFVNEGRIVASLHHPNIVTIYDIGIAGEELYISMEYVRGGDLKNRMGSPISAKKALDIIAKIGSALDSAHTHNVIHRDVKPANILFRQDDTPLLTDFGIAKQTNIDKDLTSTGIFLGSPNYISPEQTEGKNVDGRSDIYSLGCIFHEMLTGHKPYRAKSIVDLFMQHKTYPVPTLPEKFEIYQPLLNRMMAKNLDERFANAQEMLKNVNKLQALADSGNNKIVSESDISGHTPPKMAPKSTRKKSNIILFSALSLSAILFFGLQFVDIRLKGSETKTNLASTNSNLPNLKTGSANLAEQTLAAIKTSSKANTPQSSSAETKATATKIKPASEQVMQALAWLGKKSLDEYKLTYPPKDNAYYYFSHLLELEPNNRTAYKGILAIAERYAMLAERSLAHNDIKKTRAYIELGLQIDPKNKALLSLQTLVSKQKTGFWQMLKSFF